MIAIKKQQLIWKNLASLGIIQFANVLMPLLSVPIISRIIGPDKFGAINYVAAFVTYFTILIGYGFNLTATRRIAVDPDNQKLRNTVFSEVFYCQAILLFVSVAIFSGLVFTVPNLASDKKLAYVSILFCVSTVLTQNWLFQAMRALSKIAILNLSGKFIYLISVLVIIESEEDYYWQPLALSLSQICVSICSFIWAKKKYQLQLTAFNYSHCIAILKKDKSVFFSIILNSFYTTANIVILGLFQSDKEVGFYSSGQKLIMMAQMMIVLPLSQILYPIIGKSLFEDRKKGIEIIQKLAAPILFTTTLLGISILIIGPFFLPLFYGEEFKKATLGFQILCFIPLLTALNNLMGIQIMINIGMDKIYLKLILFGSIFSIISNIYMANIWGYIGTSLNWTITELIIFILLFTKLKQSNINIFNPIFLKPNYIFQAMSFNKKNI